MSDDNAQNPFEDYRASKEAPVTAAATLVAPKPAKGVSTPAESSDNNPFEEHRAAKDINAASSPFETYRADKESAATTTPEKETYGAGTRVENAVGGAVAPYVKSAVNMVAHPLKALDTANEFYHKMAAPPSTEEMAGNSRLGVIAPTASTPRRIAGALGELGTTIPNMARQGYHAFVDEPTEEEKKLAINNPITGTESLLGRGALAAKRMLVDPQLAEEQKAKKLEDTKGRTLESAAHRVAGMVPMLGPMASQLGEQAGTGDIAGAVTKGVGYAAAPEIAKEAMPGGRIAERTFGTNLPIPDALRAAGENQEAFPTIKTAADLAKRGAQATVRTIARNPVKSIALPIAAVTAPHTLIPLGVEAALGGTSKLIPGISQGWTHIVEKYMPEKLRNMGLAEPQVAMEKFQSMVRDAKEDVDTAQKKADLYTKTGQQVPSKEQEALNSATAEHQRLSASLQAAKENWESEKAYKSIYDKDAGKSGLPKNPTPQVRDAVLAQSQRPGAHADYIQGLVKQYGTDTTDHGFSKSGNPSPTGMPQMNVEPATSPAAEAPRINPRDVEAQLNRGMDNEAIKPGVAMRDQGKAPAIELPVKPPTSQDVHIHGERMEDAVTKHAEKYGLDTNDLRKQIHGVTNAELGELASRAGVDMANKTVGRAKNVPNQVSRPELFNQLLDRKATPQTILDLKNNSKWTMDDKGSPVTEEGVRPVSGSAPVKPKVHGPVEEFEKIPVEDRAVEPLSKYETTVPQGHVGKSTPIFPIPELKTMQSEFLNRGGSIKQPPIGNARNVDPATSALTRSIWGTEAPHIATRGGIAETASPSSIPARVLNDDAFMRPNTLGKAPKEKGPIDDMTESRREAFRQADNERTKLAADAKAKELAPTEAEKRAEMSKGWRSKYATEDEAYKAWTDAHEELAKVVGVSKRLDRALAKAGAPVGTVERYTGKFYNDVLAHLKTKMSPEEALDATQETMEAFQQNVNDGGYKLPASVADDDNVKRYIINGIADKKAARWVKNINDESKTKVGNPRMSSVEGSSASDKGPDALNEHEEDKAEQQHPFGSGKQPGTTDAETEDAASALNKFFDEHPDPNAESPMVTKLNREKLLAASAKSIAKAKAIGNDAYNKALKSSRKVTTEGKESEARQAKLDAVQTFHYNTRKGRISNDTFFGLNDKEMTDVGQTYKMSGPAFREFINSTLKPWKEEAKTAPTSKYPGAAGSSTWNSAKADNTQGITLPRAALGKIERGSPTSTESRPATENAHPTIAKPSETYGSATGATNRKFTPVQTKAETITIPGHKATDPSEEYQSLLADREKSLVPQHHSEIPERKYIAEQRSRGRTIAPGSPATQRGIVTEGPGPRTVNVPAGRTIHGAGNVEQLTEPLPVGKPALAEAPRITSRAPVINPADTSWNRERLGDLRSQELIDNRARQQAKARIMEKLKNARDNAKTYKDKLAAQIKLGDAKIALDLSGELPGKEVRGLRRVKNSSGLGRAK